MHRARALSLRTGAPTEGERAAPLQQSAAVAAASSMPGAAVYVSRDGGASFEVGGLQLEGDAQFTSVKAGPSGTFWAASQGLVDDVVRMQVHRSNDGGSTWTSHEVAVEVEVDEDDPRLVVMEAAAEDADAAWLLVDYTAVDTLVAATAGGAAITTLATVQGFVTDVAVDEEGGLWLAEQGLFFSYAPPGGTLERVTAPPGLGVGVRGDEVRVTARFEMSNQCLLLRGDDGTFAPEMTFYDAVGPRTCPAGTAGADVCGPAWETLSISLGMGLDTDLADTGSPAPEPTPGPSGCSCRQAASPAGPLVLVWWLLVGLVGWRRRTN